MKKITIFVAALAVLASCNREDQLGQLAGSESNVNVKHYEASELPVGVIPMNSSFSSSQKGKANAGVQVNYTYRGYAEPVTLSLGTVNLAASSVLSINDMLFVTWHDHDNGNSSSVKAFGGAICAYKQSGIGQYRLTDRIDFADADYHEVAGSINKEVGNYELVMVGQRNQASSGYLLESHAGAIVSRIDYDYINDEFWEPSFKELPLPGVSANGVVAAVKGYFIVTGNGEGGENLDPTALDYSGHVYSVNRDLTNVIAMWSLTGDGIEIAADSRSLSPTSADLVVASRTKNTSGDYNMQLHKFVVNETSPGVRTVAQTPLAATTTKVDDMIPNERGSIVFVESMFGDQAIFVAVAQDGTGGTRSIYSVDGSGDLVPNLNATYGTCQSAAYDVSNDLLYYGAGDDGLRILAGPTFAGFAGPLVNDFDVVGEFDDPKDAGGVLIGPGIDEVKEIAIYQSRNIAIVTGNDGVYFIQKDK
ncbi:MAG: hypothetical protein ACI9YE_003093 [Psychroserpens sp.]|jgi:hypothetical protein